MKNNKGIATYIVIVLVAFIALSLSNVSILNRGEMNQVVKSEALIKIDLASRSVYNKFSWRLKCLTYDNRPCKDSAYSEQSEFENIKCELLCYDSEDESESLDIWILAKSDNANKTTFYRVKYQQSLINTYNKIVPVFSSSYSIDDFPTSKTSPKTPQKILAMLKSQQENMKNRSAIVKSIENTNNIIQILSKLNINSTGDILTKVPSVSMDSPGKYLNISPPSSQTSDLLSVNSLKKTDMAMQLAAANAVFTDDQSVDLGGTGIPGVSTPAAGGGAPQPSSISSGGGGGNGIPGVSTPSAGGGGGGGVAPPSTLGGIGNPGPQPQPRKASYVERLAAWLKTNSANAKLAIKTLLGTADEEDAQRAREANEKFLAIAKPGSLSSKIAKFFNKRIINTFNNKKK